MLDLTKLTFEELVAQFKNLIQSKRRVEGCAAVFYWDYAN
jgi:hypothetical protein